MANNDDALIKRINSFAKNPKTMPKVVKLLRTKILNNPDLNMDIINKLHPTYVRMVNFKNTVVLADMAFIIGNLAGRNIQAIIDHGSVPHFIKNLRRPYEDALVREKIDWEEIITFIGTIGIKQFLKEAVKDLVRMMGFKNAVLVKESTWALANLTHEKEMAQVKQMIIEEDKALCFIKKLLASKDFDILKNILSIIINIADGDVNQKESLIESDIMKPLFDLFESRRIEIVDLALRAMGCLAKGGTIEQKEKIIDLQVVPIFVRNLSSKKGKFAQYSACGLKDIAESKIGVDITKQIQHIIDAYAVPSLIKLLESDKHGDVIEAMDALINISSCDPKQSKYVLDSPKMIFHIKKLLNHRDREFTKRVIQLISNFLGYNDNQVNTIINDKKLIPLIVKKLDGNALEIQKLLIDIVKYVINFKPKYILFLLNFDITRKLCDLLKSNEVEIVKCGLFGLKTIFEKAENNIEIVRGKFDECEGQEKIYGLQNHDNEEIQALANSFLDIKPRPPPIPSIRFTGILCDENNDEELRKLNVGEWEYRRDENGEKEKQIIVFEPNKELLACEYRNTENDMYCLGCYKINQREKCLAIKKNGIIYVPINEVHRCNPREVEEIEKEQATYLQKSRKRTHKKQSSSIPNRRSTRNKKARATSSTYLQNNSETSISADRESGVDYNDVDDGSGPSNSRSIVNASPTSSSSNTNSETANNGSGAATLRNQETTSVVDTSRNRFAVDENGKFKFIFDIQDYKHEEIKINIKDRELIVTGNHQTEDENGILEKQFTRRFTVPENVDIESIKCISMKRTMPLKFKANRWL